MKKMLVIILIWLVVIWCLAPFVWQIITSLKTDAQIAARPTIYLPNEMNMHSYQALFARKPFARYLLNSTVISGLSTLLCLLIGSLAAYAAARLKVRGSGVMSATLIAVALFPPIIFFFPIYEMVRVTHTANTPLALIVPYVMFNLPFTVLLLTAYFRTVPVDIEDAAKVDGLGRWQILVRIMLPLSTPALATTGILVFIFCWNEFLLAVTFMTRDSAKTLTAGIASLSGTTVYELPWGPISAAVVVSTLPLILLVAIFQRRIVQGLTAGATKG